MTFSEWIKSQLEALREMIVADDDQPAPCDGQPVTDPGEVHESKMPEKLDLCFPSDTRHLGRVRKSIEQFAMECGLDQAACDEIGLVVNEALANVIRHAYSGVKGMPIEIEVKALHPGIKLSMRDWGNGVQPKMTIEAEKDPLIPGGLGLICMRKLMDEAKFVPQPDGMLLVLKRTSNGSRAKLYDRADHATGGATA